MQRQAFWCLRPVLGTLPVMLLCVGPIADSARAQSAASESPSAQRRAAAEHVSQALQAEIEGKNSRRGALLREALEAVPDLAPARWHSGFVRADNSWVKFDERPASTQNQRLAAYLLFRAKYRETVEDQWALAAWCKKANLQDQWRAHLGNVLALNPDHAEARALLGYQRVDGVWLAPREIQRANVRAAAAVAALKQWKPKLLAIRSGLQQTNPSRREVARQRLTAVQDAAAVPSLELVFCTESEPMALVGVKKFAEMSVADASLALARQALFSPWPTVRQAAVEKLKTRNRETFVPELLSAMASPTQSRMELFRDPDGRLFYRHAFYQPGQERNELLVLDTIYENNVAFNPYISSVSDQRPRSAPNQGPRSLIFDDGTRATALGNGTVQSVGPQTPYSTSEIREAAALARANQLTSNTHVTLTPATSAAAAIMASPARIQAQVQAQTQAQQVVGAAMTAQARETDVARNNARTVALNAAICQLLTTVTGENLPQSPEDWAEWWAESDEVYVPGYKPLEVSYVPTEQATRQDLPVPLREVITSVPVPAGPIHFSCLAAGTPVWTNTGPVAVEKIKVGDRVLSQDFETGELAYKPVLHTTVRLKAELVKLDLREETVTCSVGHAFWVSGKGWVKARDLQPGMNFHGAEGTTPLQRSESAGVGSVYNLIVGDFHSYFVGKALIYSHDITARKPCDLLVPGLARR